MSFEVELKAWVDDVPRTEEKLNMLADYAFAYSKKDTYFFMNKEGAFPSGVRLRDEAHVLPDGAREEKILVTYKTKELRGEIEVNEEHEFCVTGNGSAFAGFLERAGFTPGFCKTKEGKCWAYRSGFFPVNVELSRVEGLGYFLELEIILESEDGQTVENAGAALRALLEKTGISARRIESRYYSEMLGQR
ncbi:MAG: class IV adenylate cyclase [Spirochaetaceae bacterium]|jgi:predicted adenylyl cyclase CyaB|nr:class IV adenylate cyclase [Spirochaetaceae bacterium]